MDRKLSGKVAIVTGASRGIGAAIAMRLAADGAGVAVNFASREQPAREIVKRIEAAGGKALAIGADVSDPAAVTKLFDDVARALGKPDVLVSNAGMYDLRAVGEIDAAHYDKVMALNVRGAVLVGSEMARRMNDGGRIVLISSGAARFGMAGGSVYAASKAAVEALARCWAVDLGPRGITVNAVAPGLTETEMFRENKWPKEAIDAMVRQTALGRLGQPDDVADAVAFFCSPDARWVTGTFVDVNGGIHM